MAKAIQEAKVSPVPSPNLWIRVSGTTRFGGEPVQEIKWFDICRRCTCDNSCATDVSSIGDAEEEKVPLSLLLAALLNVNRQLKRAGSFLKFKILVTLIASPSSTCLISSCDCQAASGGMLLVHSSPWKANLDCLHSLVFSASPFDSVAVQSVPSCSSFEIAP